MEKFSARIISGNYYVGLEGYTFTKTPNKVGNIMFYSNSGRNPYRIVLKSEDIEFYNNKGE